MNALLNATFLAAGKDEGDGWINILFIVVVAVFWAVSGIIKARADKAEMKKQQNAQPKRPQTQRSQVQSRTDMRRREPMRHPAHTKPSKANEIATIKSARVSSIGTEIAKEPVIKEIPDTLVEPLIQDSLRIRTTRQKEKTAIKRSIPLKGPETLRNAILYYEILGKPISLREPDRKLF